MPPRVHSDGKAPLVAANFHVKVVVGDPNDPRRMAKTFHAGANDPKSRRPLASMLGGWFNDKPAGARKLNSASDALPDESYLCDTATQLGADCEVYTNGWEAISPDEGISSSISCPSDHPYLAWYGDTNGQYGGSDSPWYDWERDHWTITLWSFDEVDDPTGGDAFTGVSYSGQNWNTIWGDTWNYAMFIPCTVQNGWGGLGYSAGTG
jgi:hypothetical protein